MTVVSYPTLQRELQTIDPDTYALTVLSTLHIAHGNEAKQASAEDLIYTKYQGIAIAGVTLVEHSTTQDITPIQTEALQFGGMVAIVASSQLPDSPALQIELQSIQGEDFRSALIRVLDQGYSKGLDDLTQSCDTLSRDYPAMFSLMHMLPYYCEGTEMPDPEKLTFEAGALAVNLAFKEMIDTAGLESIPTVK